MRFDPILNIIVATFRKSNARVYERVYINLSVYKFNEVTLINLLFI